MAGTSDSVVLLHWRLFSAQYPFSMPLGMCSEFPSGTPLAPSSTPCDLVSGWSGTRSVRRCSPGSSEWPGGQYVEPRMKPERADSDKVGPYCHGLSCWLCTYRHGKSPTCTHLYIGVIIISAAWERVPVKCCPLCMAHS